MPAGSGRREHPATRWFLVAGASALLLLYVAWHVRAFLPQSAGRFTYPADDVYIEMSLARTLASTGGWGMVPGEFTGVGSSLLWPWLLAVLRLVSPTDWMPLVLASSGAIGAIVVAEIGMSRHGLPWRWRAAALCILVALTPLASLAALGMEHTLQVAVAIALAAASALAIDTADGTTRTLVVIATLSAAAMATRYDLGSVVAAVVLIATWRRQLRIVVAVVAGAAVPVLVYAVVAHNHNWPLVPVTLLLKHRLAGGVTSSTLFLGPLRLLRHAAYLWTPLAAGVALFAWRRSTLLAVYVLAALVQIEFGISGHTPEWRYDVYVAALAVVALACAARPAIMSLPRRAMPLALTAAMALLIAVAERRQTGRVERRIIDDVSQQWHTTSQIAAFLESAPWIRTPALEDLGETTYRTGRAILDLDYLGTPEVFEALMSHTWTAARFEEIARGHGTTTMVLIRPSSASFSWIEVGEWRQERADINCCSFFAADEATAEHLARSLDAFAPHLAGGMTWRRRFQP